MGPKTKSANGKKKNDKKKNAEDKERLEIIKKLKMILKEYEKQCNKQGSSVDIKLKSLLLSHISDGKHLIRVRNNIIMIYDIVVNLTTILFILFITGPIEQQKFLYMYISYDWCIFLFLNWLILYKYS